jgi:hypothetical protein
LTSAQSITSGFFTSGSAIAVPDLSKQLWLPEFPLLFETKLFKKSSISCFALYTASSDPDRITEVVWPKFSSHFSPI